MSEQTAKKQATYQDLYNLPENMIGEILNGELVATPRPSYRHGIAAASLEVFIGGPYHFGVGGGPGGWWILVEPEIHFGEHVLVPDLAGWRRERMPEPPEGNWTDIAPDWVCEILSPNTAGVDRVKKMPIYAQYGAKNIWLVDSGYRTLEIFRLAEGRWILISTHAQNQKVRGEPFGDVELDLSLLWGES